MDEKRIYVIGLDDFNLKKLQNIEHPHERYVFEELLPYRDVQHEGRYPFAPALKHAEKRLVQLRESGRQIDALIGYWDFPVPSINAILGEKYGYPAPPLEATLKCEHKYWSRLEQQKVIPECTPKFAALDPFSSLDTANPPIPFPFWIKPIKSFSSQLGFYIDNPKDYRQALRVIRSGIERFAEPFNQALKHIELPDEVRDVDGHFCILEQIISGRQSTVEGYVFNGEAYVYGTVDSFRFKNVSSFSRYQYPSMLPRHIYRRMAETSKRLMLALGYDNATFNIEFFWNEKTDDLWLLEVNPRLSQSHSAIFRYVDGISNLDKMVQIALGRRPPETWEKGEFDVAAKCFHRKFEDACVDRVPSQEEVDRIEQEVPGLAIQIVAQPGRRLSELQNQDSYSFELALLHIAGNTEQEVLDKFDRAVEKLDFRFSDERAIYANVA